MRAAHVVKGAAANLFCPQLQTAAKNLEDCARMAHQEVPLRQETKDKVEGAVKDMHAAANLYFQFLTSISV